jgi:hypothetical protein
VRSRHAKADRHRRGAGRARLTASALAGVTKYTFNDVTYPDGTTGEIEAGVRDTKKSDHTNCTYFSDDYRQALGYHADAGRLHHRGGGQAVLP